MAVSAFSVASLFSSPSVLQAAPLQQSSDDLAVLRDYLSGNGMLNRGLYELAAEEYQKFLREHSNHEKAPHARYGLGVALFRQNKYADAATELALIEERRGFEFAAETNLLLGQACVQLNRFDDAEKAFARVVSDHADHDVADDAAAMRVETLYRLNRHEEVAPAARAFLETWPQNALRERVELFDGLSHVARNDTDRAVERFENMLRRFPEGEHSRRATLLLARSYQRAGRAGDAVAQYRRVLEQEDPAFVPDALYALGAILRREGDGREAAKYLDRLIEGHAENPLVPAAQFERGRVHLDAGEVDEAIGLFAMVEQAKSDLADDAAYWAAKADMRENEFERAASRLGEAQATYPNSPLRAEMQYDQAVAQLRAGAREDAIDTLRAFRAAHPDHAMSAEALHLMATTAHALEDYAASRTYSDQYLGQYAGGERAADLAFLSAENAFLAGDYENAANGFESFVEAHGEHSQAKSAAYRLGLSRDRLGNADGAREALAGVVNGKRTPAPFAHALFVLGSIAFEKGEWKEAERQFFDYLSFDDQQNAADALIRLGLSQQRQNKHDSAVATYARLLEEHPESVHGMQALFERGQALVALGRPDEAAESFESLLQLEGVERFAPHALNHLGAIAMARSDYDEAAARYDAIGSYEVDPALAGEALFQKGQALTALERFKDAEKAFAEVAAEYPLHDRAALARANAALSIARQGDAARTLATIKAFDEKALGAVSPELRTSLLYEKAWAQRSLEQNDDAAATYRTIIEIESASDLRPYARVELAELLAAKREFDNAAALLREVAYDDDSLPGALHERGLYRLGVSEYELGRHREAADTLSQFIRAHDESGMIGSARLLCGESLFKLGEYREALPHLEAVAKIEDAGDDLRAPALLRLGECRAHLQNWDASEEAFAQYLKAYPESDVWFQAQFGIGWARENDGRFDDAVAAYRTVVDRHQGATAARAQFQIGECLFAQKKHDEAVRELLKVDILYAYPEWSSAALFEAGKCFEAMHQIGQAKRQYELVQARYADTKWADMAGKRLADLAKRDLPGRGGG